MQNNKDNRGFKKGARDPALMPEMVRVGIPHSALRLERAGIKGSYFHLRLKKGSLPKGACNVIRKPSGATISDKAASPRGSLSTRERLNSKGATGKTL